MERTSHSYHTRSFGISQQPSTMTGSKVRTFSFSMQIDKQKKFLVDKHYNTAIIKIRE